MGDDRRGKTQQERVFQGGGQQKASETHSIIRESWSLPTGMHPSNSGRFDAPFFGDRIGWVKYRRVRLKPKLMSERSSFSAKLKAANLHHRKFQKSTLKIQNQGVLSLKRHLVLNDFVPVSLHGHLLGFRNHQALVCCNCLCRTGAIALGILVASLIQWRGKTNEKHRDIHVQCIHINIIHNKCV